MRLKTSVVGNSLKSFWAKSHMIMNTNLIFHKLFLLIASAECIYEISSIIKVDESSKNCFCNVIKMHEVLKFCPHSQHTCHFVCHFILPSDGRGEKPQKCLQETQMSHT
jgi:hypothetical protein